MRWRAAIVVVIVVVIAGCSSRGPAADHFLAVMAPVNAATTSFQRSVQRLGSHPTAAQAAVAAQAFVAAIQRLDAQLLDYRWPTPATSDIDRLVATDRALITALGSTTDVSSFSPAGWAAMLRAGEQAVLSASTAVRADLGLPAGG